MTDNSNCFSIKGIKHGQCSYPIPLKNLQTKKAQKDCTTLETKTPIPFTVKDHIRMDRRPR